MIGVRKSLTLVHFIIKALLNSLNVQSKIQFTVGAVKVSHLFDALI